VSILETGGAEQFSQFTWNAARRLGFARPASSPTGSAAPTLQCTDLARELIEIDVVTSDDVPIGITNQEVVADHVSLSGTARCGYAHVRSAVGKQLVHPAAQC